MLAIVVVVILVLGNKLNIFLGSSDTIMVEVVLELCIVLDIFPGSYEAMIVVVVMMEVVLVLGFVMHNLIG